MNVLALAACLSVISSSFNRPAVFHIDQQPFALFKHEDHFQFLPCLSKDTNIVFFDYNRSYVEQVEKWVDMYGKDWEWKYINDEQTLYDWFEWSIQSVPHHTPLLVDSYFRFEESIRN